MFVWSKEQARVLLQDNPSLASKNVQDASGSSESECSSVPLPPDSGCGASLAECSGESGASRSVKIPLNEDYEIPPWWSGKIILDLGAGDGHVTQILAEDAKEIYVTETSTIMRRKLVGSGYK